MRRIHTEVNKPNRLFDFIRKEYRLPNDVAVARFLCTSSPVISRIRHGDCGLPPFLILNIYDKTELSIDEIREMVKEVG
jgi:hypothetical protein